MTSSSVPPAHAGTTPRAASRSMLTRRLVSLTPLWLLIVLSVASPSFFQPMFAKPPEIEGVPLGLVFTGIAMVWMLLGTVLIWDARSQVVQSLVLLLFTIPATVLVVFTPAVILIMQNLG
jgi:hypothetical protein